MRGIGIFLSVLGICLLNAFVYFIVEVCLG
jgi:hypothetical protein